MLKSLTTFRSKFDWITTKIDQKDWQKKMRENNETNRSTGSIHSHMMFIPMNHTKHQSLIEPRRFNHFVDGTDQPPPLPVKKKHSKWLFSVKISFDEFHYYMKFPWRKMIWMIYSCHQSSFLDIGQIQLHAFISFNISFTNFLILHRFSISLSLTHMIWF